MEPKMPPIHHAVRVRSTDDLTYIQPGLMDEVVINANQLENSLRSTIETLQGNNLPYSIDPVLWRFQTRGWVENQDGKVKRNYGSLGSQYFRHTDIDPSDCCLSELPGDSRTWTQISTNAVQYQLRRVSSVPTQLSLLTDRRVLSPSRVLAPSLVAFSTAEDKVNRLMAEAAADVAQSPVAVSVNVPRKRLVDAASMQALQDSLPYGDGVASYSLWLEGVPESLLMRDHDALSALLRLIEALKHRGHPIEHQHGSYLTLALCALGGVDAISHHLAWTDTGNAANGSSPPFRSCRTYAPGVRHPITFHEAEAIAGDMAASQYLELFCGCKFCKGMFDQGQHPFDILLESRDLTLKNGNSRTVPTSRSVGANTWHYLLARREEVLAFSETSALEILARDIHRSSLLNRQDDAELLQVLAGQIDNAA